MCSAKWAKLSWQDKVGSGLTLINGVVLSILSYVSKGGETGGLQTHCKFFSKWSEHTVLKTLVASSGTCRVSLSVWIQAVEAGVPRGSVSVFVSSMCSPAWVPREYTVALCTIIYAFPLGNSCLMSHRLNFACVDFLFFISISYRETICSERNIYAVCFSLENGCSVYCDYF